MALINIDMVQRESLRFLEAASVGGGVELMSYKRNRIIALIKDSESHVTLREKGYVEEEVVLAIDSLAKDLKKRMKREFPRSRKVRLVKFSDAAELDRIHQKI